jgi:putative addiction module CopG family antidote
MDITLPATLKYFVETRVKNGDYADESDVVREALRFRMAVERREANVVQGALIANSGNAVDGEIETDVFLVMMEAAKSAGDDLKMIMAGVKAMTAAKARLRDLIRKVARDVRKNAAATEGEASLDFSEGLGSEAAYHLAPMPVEDVESPSGVTLVETDLSPARITRLDQLRAVLDDLKGRLDSLSEMGEMESLRLQMAMDRRAKLLSTLSNIMKKLSDTRASITQNLK